jgi:hypothetical protein
MTTTTGSYGISGRRVSRTTTPRTRGALTGFGLMLLGAWGAFIPFVGPYFDYAYAPDRTWTWTAARFWLQVLPGAVTFFAGLVLLLTAHRVVAWFAAWLAIAAGAWYVVGPLLVPLWRSNYLGSPVGNRTDVSVEAIGMFYGLGAAIILLAALAAGRFSVVGVRDVALSPVEAEVPASEPAPAVRDSAVRDSAVRDTAVRDDAVRDDAVRETAVRDDTVRDTAVRDDTVRNTAVGDTAVDESPMPATEEDPAVASPSGRMRT